MADKLPIVSVRIGKGGRAESSLFFTATAASFLNLPFVSKMADWVPINWQINWQLFQFDFAKEGEQSPLSLFTSIAASFLYLPSHKHEPRNYVLAFCTMVDWLSVICMAKIEKYNYSKKRNYNLEIQGIFILYKKVI